MKTLLRTCGNISTTAHCANTGRFLGHAVSVDVYREGSRRYLRLEGSVKRTDILLTDSQREELYSLQDEKEAACAFDLFNVKTMFN